MFEVTAQVDRLKVNRLKVEVERFSGYFSLQPKYLNNALE